ncbi:hypothetical protein [Streptomyces sp. NPDC090445]|uniref:hypothetical protein n=1 Tax=Streptomyces sp. NPDC090445 TaxID=3365963 RepID=UPI00382A64C2
MEPDAGPGLQHGTSDRGPPHGARLAGAGTGGWLNSALDTPDNHLEQPVDDENIYPGIQRPHEGDEPPAPEPGFHVQTEYYPWFRRVLARTSAAGLTAFAGDGTATAQYQTKRQGQRHFTGLIHAATDSVQDAHAQLHGIDFVGTDHVFRLNRTRVEAFSGIAKDLFHHLEKGQLERYHTEVHAHRKTWPLLGWDSKWDGPVSVHQDLSLGGMPSPGVSSSLMQAQSS